MQVKLTIGERLKDLRVERKLTLEQLAAEVGISKSALGKYESDNGKDISPYSILLLADYYGVSCDYLMGRTETKNHPNTALHELHLGDASIDVLRTGKFNHRLLSELICHKDFQRFMLDAEIYVDRIADMRVNDMNAVLEAVRQTALMKNGGEENDLHLWTLEVAQIREDEYFGNLIADDLKGILRDIRSEHRPDTMTADEVSFAENIIHPQKFLGIQNFFLSVKQFAPDIFPPLQHGLEQLCRSTDRYDPKDPFGQNLRSAKGG